MVLTIQLAAQQAFDVQDACNLSGCAYSFSRVMDCICTEDRLRSAAFDQARHGDMTEPERRRLAGRFGTEWKNQHPIVRLFLSKMHDLAGMGPSDVKPFGEAYDLCCKIAAGDTEAY
ncbi:MAG: hypothetical protein ACOYOB_21530 [Myxococcota bacterium]